MVSVVVLLVALGLIGGAVWLKHRAKPDADLHSPHMRRWKDQRP